MAAKNNKKYFSRYDTADYLLGEEDIAAYLGACSEENDPALMAVALDAVARTRRSPPFSIK
jgi:probable addiction module antidote protein